MWIAPFSPPDREEVGQRIDAGFRHVRIVFEIGFRVKDWVRAAEAAAPISM